MNADFETCLNVTLGFEGGYVNNPKDPGGATNMGVTQTTYDAWQKRHPDLYPTLKNVMSLTKDEAAGIYRDEYWSPINGAALPAGLDIALFDFAVNSGVHTAVSTLQNLLPGVRSDGSVGSLTLSALPTAPDAVKALVGQLDAARLAFMKKLKTWATFGNGWTTRVTTLDGLAQGHVTEVVAAPALATAATITLAPVGQGKATPVSTALVKSPMAAGALAATTGAAGQQVLQVAQQVQPHIDHSPFGHMALAACAVLFGTGGLLVGFSWYRKLKDSGFSFQEAFN